MKKEKKYCVYKHTNKINGKVYIGQTCQEIDRRWQNGEGYRGCVNFYNAIKKYGWDSFEHEALYEGLTLEEANKIEEEVIKEYKSNHPDFGYNIRPGGNNSPLAPETIEKVRKNHCDVSGEKHPMWGKHLSEETKKKISASLKGRPGYWKGKTFSEETRIKMSKSRSGFKHTEETKQWMSERRYKPVKCIETGIIYKGAKIASKETGVDNSDIGKCCKGKLKSAGGYHWEYSTQEEYQNYLNSKSN